MVRALARTGSTDGREDDVEGVCALEPCGVDGRSHVGFGLSRPHCAITVGDFSLDHAGAELAFRAVVGGFDLSGKIAKGEQLALSAGDFGLEVAGEIAIRRRGQEEAELLFQLPLFPRQGRCGQFGDAAGQVEDLAEPELEAQGKIIRSMLQREGGIARQMR